MEKESGELLFENIPIPMAYLQASGGSDNEPDDFLFRQMNPSFEIQMGIEESLYMNTGISVFFSEKDADAGDLLKDFVKTAFDRVTTEREIHFRKDDTWHQISAFSMGTDQIGIIILNITAERTLDEEINKLINLSPDMQCISDIDGTFIRVNQIFADLLGFPASELEGRNFLSLVHKDDIEATLDAVKALKNLNEVSSFTNRCLCRDGSYKYLEWHSMPAGKFIYSSARDTTMNHRKEEELTAMAYVDRLTGLYNRHYFDRRITEEIEKSEQTHEPVSIINLDLDLFKNVNDTWGHQVGDEVLANTAWVIRNSIRKTDIPARLGGEEFTVVLPNTNLDEAVTAAQKIQDMLKVNPDKSAGVVTASMGVAEKAAAESFKSWYKRADEGLYAAKHQGRNRIVRVEDAVESNIPLIPLVWNSDWNSGNVKIDEEHRNLLKLGNAILEMSYKDMPYDKTMNKLEEIIRHVARHFSDEEHILEDLAYPLCAEHSRLHKNLLDQIAFLRESYQSSGIKSSGFFSFIIKDVIVNHMLTEDVKFFAYTRR